MAGSARHHDLASVGMGPVRVDGRNLLHVVARFLERNRFGENRAFHRMGGLPKVTVLRIADVEDSGTVWAVPERWEAETPPPRVRVRERRRGTLGVGERVLARTEEAGGGWIAHPMKTLAPAAERMLGVLRGEGESGSGRLWLQGRV